QNAYGNETQFGRTIFCEAKNQGKDGIVLAIGESEQQVGLAVRRGAVDLSGQSLSDIAARKFAGGMQADAKDFFVGGAQLLEQQWEAIMASGQTGPAGGFDH